MNNQISGSDYPGKKAVVGCLGVIAIVAPWNFPLSNLKSLFPALLSGNVVILKPEHTLRTLRGY